MGRWVLGMLLRIRKWDKLAMHMAAIPMVAFLGVRAVNYAQAQEFNQAVVNQHLTDRIDTLSFRLDHLEKVGDAQLVLLLGIFASLVTNILQNKNRRR